MFMPIRVVLGGYADDTRQSYRSHSWTIGDVQVWSV